MGYPITNIFSECKGKKCNKGQYLCEKSNICIDLEHFCDGVKHCVYEDDELDCGEFPWKIFCQLVLFQNLF